MALRVLGHILLGKLMFQTKARNWKLPYERDHTVVIGGLGTGILKTRLSQGTT